MGKIKYPVGIQTFSEIREKNYKYVDKTKFVYDLASSGKYYFLSRPRRFGKSLLLSTIESLYLGKRELFEGLYVYNKKWDWVEHPVFHVALNYQDYDSIEKLDEVLHYHLRLWERQYGVAETTSIKLKSTSKAAMQQIRDKDYSLPFMSDEREVILIGAAFSSKTRRLKKWIIEKA